MKISLLHILLFLGSSVLLQANNIQVSNVGYEPITEDTYEVFFDLSWENSWRTSTFESNYDAAWVFVKFKTTSNPEWTHAMVNESGEPAPSGSELIFPSDGIGAFVQRSGDGIGDVSFSNVRLEWLLDDVIDATDRIEICVYAIEMVYIPEGPFQVGDGRDNSQGTPFEAGDSGEPFTIVSEGELTLGGTALTNLSGGSNLSDDFNSVDTQILLSTYPKGFLAFYSMKYEVSQGQYATFLNSLPNTLQIERIDESTYGFNYQSVHRIGSPYYFAADAPDRAANYLNWSDIAMYADWSGLRPMSELEYEKVCRGPEPAVANEYAWGNNFVHIEPIEYGVNEEGNEIALNPSMELGNAIAGGFSWKISNNGVFSSTSSTRQTAGASYYGVLEMTGNVNELTITVGNPEGRVFNREAHGDGLVDFSEPQWPDVEGLNEAIGTGRRGGSFYQSISHCETSYRGFASGQIITRHYGSGGRLVRSNF